MLYVVRSLRTPKKLCKVLDINLRQHAAKLTSLLVRQSDFHNDVRKDTDIGGGVLGCLGFHSGFCTTQGGLSLNIGRHLPDKAIESIDEACANVRVQLDRQPEEIVSLDRKRMHLEIELHALEKETVKDSKARLVEVRKELDEVTYNLQPLTMKYNKEQ